MPSLLLWERGLKYGSVRHRPYGYRSLLLWERGLKSAGYLSHTVVPGVAPLVGAWIEIFLSARACRLMWVAPLVGAWIEIVCYGAGGSAVIVAPLVGAWIEIFQGVS